MRNKAKAFKKIYETNPADLSKLITYRQLKKIDQCKTDWGEKLTKTQGQVNHG